MNRVSIPGMGEKSFVCPKCPYRVWGLSSAPFSGYQGSFREGVVGKQPERGPAIQLSLVPELKENGAIRPLFRLPL